MERVANGCSITQDASNGQVRVCLVLRRETKRERGRVNRIEQEKRCYDLFADVLVRLESARERERKKTYRQRTHTHRQRT